MDREDKKQIHDEMRDERHLMYHRRNWLRHNAMVPKGFLRYHVLEALNEQAMSGSELMDQIEKHTEGAWKPSPGSIYPLLAWLQDNAYIKEMPTENGLKRYELTQTGKELFAEESKMREKFSEKSGFMASPFFSRMFGNIPEQKTNQIRHSMKGLMISSMRLGRTLSENYSEQTLDEALKILDDASKKLNEINDKIKGESKHE
jgi:DNA-binding PadR family transcriptional regulator